jgi:hypothetical protein
MIIDALLLKLPEDETGTQPEAPTLVAVVDSFVTNRGDYAVRVAYHLLVC